MVVLWYLFILDLVISNMNSYQPSSMSKMFTDDTPPFSKVLYLSKSITEPNNTDLGKISQWAYQWKMHVEK